MEEGEQMIVPICDKCGSKQIRTTKLFKICNRCGNKENVE